MKLVSWNVNGLRACIQKGFLEQFDKLNADFFCLQETKLSEGQLALDLPGYEQYWCYAEKKGYSGTAIFTKHTPLSVHYGLDVPELDTEGRLITLEYPEFYLLTCYTPNAQRELARIDHRLKWDEAVRAYISKLDEKKPVILCGDLNVAHQEIDLKNPKSNRGNAGFSDQERQSFQKTLDLGFVDTFRHLHPDVTDAYSWWSYMFHAREKNAGWRIDYFLVSRRLENRIIRADIHSDIFGSDHCPVSVDLSLICNGGIWSPMTMGSSRIAGEEKETETKDKAFAEKAKALLPIGLAAAVVIALILILPAVLNPIINIPGLIDPFPDPYGDAPFTIHQYDQPLRPILSFSMPGDITQNNALLNGFTDGNTTFHVKETITERDYLQTNCWLRLELDPDMVGIVDDGWYLSFDFDNIILDNLPFKWVLPYYDSDGKDIHGFLIFVQILHDGHCITRLHAPNAVTAYESACDLTYARSTDDLMRAPCTSMPLEAPPYAFVATNTVSPHGTNLVVRFVDRQLYTPNQNIKYAIDEAMYWVFVDILPAYSHRLGTDSISMTVAPLANNPNNSDDFRTFIPLYSDVTCSQLDGWLIYGSEANCENLDQMEYSTECFYYLTRLTTSHTSPVNIVITDLTASRMNTSYLLNTLMRNPDFYKTVNGSNNSSALIYTLTDNYSAFRELMWRNDAVQEIMNYFQILPS